jgi:Mor family transcriptional regulator
MSYPALAERYNVCKDTIRGVIAGTWKPKPSKLPAEDSQLYLEYLMLGTYTAVARQYDVTEASVRKRIRALVIREGV